MIVDTAGLLTPGIKTPEGIAKYNNGTGLRTLYAIHAPANQYVNEQFLKGKMRDHLMNGFNVTNVEFLNTKAWTYFPRYINQTSYISYMFKNRWTPEEVVEGRHWDVFKMQVKRFILSTIFFLFSLPLQGQNRIWFAGSSASYESVRSVVSYNNRLLKQMIPRSSFKSASSSFVQQGAEAFFHNRKGFSTAINVNSCKYSCTSSGGCEVDNLFRFNISNPFCFRSDT